MATPKWITLYWIPMYEDAGYSYIFSSIGPQGLGQTELIEAVNSLGSLPDMNWEMICEYISDVQNSGELTCCEMVGIELPLPTTRNVAPTGIGQSQDAVWFDTPNTGIATIAWFVNGALIVERQYDTTVDRSISKTELGCTVGDVVQLCVKDGDVYGWWARVQIT